MSRPRCARTWEVEAARDGRLHPDALAAFHQHRKGCLHCQREQRALDALGQRLGAATGPIDELTLRRLRQRTLERASERLVQPRRARRPLAFLVAAGTVAVLALWLAARPSAPSLAAPVLHVEAQQSAQWHRALERGVERVALSDGTLLLRVARRPGDPRVLIQVPDGEIEDLGTVFSVTVQEGKTREIVVLEGRVTFHRSDASTVNLIAGTSWRAPVAPAPQAAPAKTEPEPELAPQRKVRKPRRTPVGPVAAVEPPADPHVQEDAAYLRILALLREGRRDEARLEALSYLRAYPNGFRAPEVSKVAALRMDGAR